MAGPGSEKITDLDLNVKDPDPGFHLYDVSYGRGCVFPLLITMLANPAIRKLMHCLHVR
jgi:hypothetical protein